MTNHNEDNIKEHIGLFQKLTPIDVMSIDGYEEALEYTFKNSDINNIALTGSFSSGKSSLIRTYEKKHNKSFYYISLAHFKNEEPHYSEETIERKIINQLIQQAPMDLVTRAGFEVKRDDNSIQRNWFCIGVTTFIITAFIISKYKFLYDVFSLNKESLKIAIIIYVFMLLIAAILLFLGIKKLLKYQLTHRAIRRIALLGNEVQLTDAEDSFFDKHLDEILYCLVHADIDGIVFEDLDRIESIDIFERLRELNILANYRLKGTQKAVRFFYLVKDDLFIDNKDRTKFFDIIIPVIPVIDSSNSYDKIKEHLVGIGKYRHINDHFLRSVSLYIDDYRILKNICNEYVVYESKLNKINLNHTILLAIIIYKNIFPKDFAELQLNRGLIYSIIKSKEKLIEDRTVELKQRLEVLNERIEASNNEFIKDTEDLQYIGEGYQRHNPNSYRDFINNELPLRRQRIEDKKDASIEAIDKERNQIIKELENIKRSSLEALLDNHTIDFLFGEYNPQYMAYIQYDEYKNIKESQYFGLLKHLVYRGYINETYADYMSYFYGNSLDANDKIFVRSVKEGNGLSYEYKLHNVKEIIQYLDEFDFDQVEILNIDLFDYLLNSSYKKVCNQCITQLRDNTSFSFIRDYLSKGSEEDKFIDAILRVWPEFFSIILKENVYEDALIRHLSYLAVSNCSPDILVLANVDSCLTSYISDAENYICNNQNLDATVTIKNLKALNVKFKGIVFDGCDLNLFEEVYDNDLYEINESNIRLMMAVKAHVDDVDRALQSLMTSVDEGKDPLYKYLSANIGRTMDVYLSMVDNIGDRSEIITDVLNNDDITDGNKKAYIEALTTVIDDLEVVKNQDYWKVILENGAMEYSASNIITYYKVFKLDSYLIEFINDNECDIDYQEIEENVRERFISECINCNQIKINKYLQFANYLQEPFTDFSISGLDNDKVEGLIDNGLITMTARNLVFIRTEYEASVLLFIRNNYDAYTELAKGTLFDVKEAQQILNCKNITDKNKLVLLGNCNQSISVRNLKCSDSLIIYILNNCFDTNDIPYLLKTYSNRPKHIKAVMLSIFINNSNATIAYSNAAEFEAVYDICKDERWSFNQKVKMLKGSVSNLTTENLVSILSILGADKIANNLSGGKKEVEATVENNVLLEALRSADIIEPYELRKDDRKRYRKIRLKKEMQK